MVDGITIPPYKALYSSLTIQSSELHGLGVFAIENIPASICLGISHVRSWFEEDMERYHRDYIRTPLGGFVNHSPEPNCCKVGIFENGDSFSLDGVGGLARLSDTMAIMTLRDIVAGEEITVSYTIYPFP